MMKTWEEEPWTQAGTSLGDRQVGDEFSRRYVTDLDDGTFLVFTEVYGVEKNPAGEYEVTRFTEATLCDDWQDPGGTEISSDDEWELYASGYATAEDAARFAETIVYHLVQ